MPKRSRKKLTAQDTNQLAYRLVQKTIGTSAELEGKNPAAVVLGRLGGLKGGKARASVLSKKKRSEIAKKAAEIRWRKANG